MYANIAYPRFQKTQPVGKKLQWLFSMTRGLENSYFSNSDVIVQRLFIKQSKCHMKQKLLLIARRGKDPLIRFIFIVP